MDELEESEHSSLYECIQALIEEALGFGQDQGYMERGEGVCTSNYRREKSYRPEIKPVYFLPLPSYISDSTPSYMEAGIKPQ